MTSVDKVIEAIRKKFPEASTGEAREFAMDLIDYGQRIRKRSKCKPFNGKEIKLLIGKGFKQ